MSPLSDTPSVEELLPLTIVSSCVGSAPLLQGLSTNFDLDLQATLQGAEAVEAVLEATPDKPSPVIGIQENKIMRQPLMEAVKKVR